MTNFVEQENCNKCGGLISYHKPFDNANFAVAECKGKVPGNKHGRQTFIIELEEINPSNIHPGPEATDEKS